MDVPPDMLAAFESNRDQLLSIDGVVGADIGFTEPDGTPTGDLAIRVLVPDLANPPAGIPETVDGFAVTIVERDIQLTQDLGHYDPVQGGVSVGRGSGLSARGTLGAVVLDATSNELRGLSCAHVFCMGAFAAGDDIQRHQVPARHLPVRCHHGLPGVLPQPGGHRRHHRDRALVHRGCAQHGGASGTRHPRGAALLSVGSPGRPHAATPAVRGRRSADPGTPMVRNRRRRAACGGPDGSGQVPAAGFGSPACDALGGGPSVGRQFSSRCAHAGLIPGRRSPAQVAVPGLGTATLVPHDVRFDESRNAWICDVPVDAGGAYAAFIRLAVVRYQPHSLPGLAVSRVVVAPFVQVLPERQVFFTPPAPDAPDTYGVLVAGITYSGGALPAPPDPSGDGVVDIQGIDPPPDLVEVTVQQRLPGTADDAGWRTAPQRLVFAETLLI